MRTTTRVIWLLLPLSVVITSLALTASSEEMRAGIVAGVQGSAKVNRASLTEPRDLRIKDDVYLRDEIATGDASMARILLGGKALLTVRERSVVKITEVPGVSTVSVNSGRAAINVIKERMRPGDSVEIVTPNAVAAIRGTIVIAEVEPDATQTRSTITVLRGLIDVIQRDDNGRPFGAPVSVSALQQVIAVGRQLSPVHAISRQTADRLSNDFKMGLRATPTAPGMVQTEVDRAVQKLATVKDSSGGDIKTTDTKTADTTTADTKTADSSTGDSKTGDSKTGDSKTGDSKTADAKAADTKSGDSKAGDSKSAGSSTGVAAAGNSGGNGGANVGGSGSPGSDRGGNGGGAGDRIAGGNGGGAGDRITGGNVGVDRIVGVGGGGGDRDRDRDRDRDSDRGNRDRSSKKR